MPMFDEPGVGGPTPDASQTAQTALDAAKKTAMIVDAAVEKATTAVDDKYQFGYNAPSMQFGDRHHNNTTENQTSSGKNPINGNRGQNKAMFNDGKAEGFSSVVDRSSGSYSVGEGNDGNISVNGHYNSRKKLDLNPVAERTYDAAKQQYEETDSSQGKQELNRRGKTFGVGSMGRKMDKVSIQHSMYDRANKVSAEQAEQMRSLFGAGYITGTTAGERRLTNVVADYQSNLSGVYSYLEKQRINAKNLSEREIKKALEQGELKGFWHHGDTISLTKSPSNPEADNIRFALEELKNLRQTGRMVEDYKNHAGGIKNTVKSWMYETSDGTDVASGYKVVKTGQGLAKVGVRIGKAGLATGINAGIGVVGKAKQVNAIKNTLKAKYMVKHASDAAAKSKYMVHLAEAKEQSVIIRQKTREYKHSVRSFTNKTLKQHVNELAPVKSVRSTIRQKVINPITRPFKAVSDRLRNTVIAKAHTKFKLFTGNLKKWILIGGAGFFLAIIVLDVILLCGSAKTETADYDYEKGETVQDSVAQKLINHLYSYQYAYSINGTTCDPSNIDAEGNLLIEKRLPMSWFEQIKAVDYDIDNQEEKGVAVFWDGSIAGYNFKKYWGQRADKSGMPPGLDSFENDNYYKAEVAVWDGTYDEELQYVYNYETGTSDWEVVEVEHMETVPIYLYGYAGMKDDANDKFDENYYIGNYITKLNFYDDMFKYNISHDSVAYENWLERENPDVTIRYHYFGSKYCFDYTGNKESKFRDLEGTWHYYNVDELYKSILTVTMALTNNSGASEMETLYNNAEIVFDNYDFVKLYAKNLFDLVMDNATVTLETKYEENPEDVLTWTFYDEALDAYTPLEAVGYRCHVTLDIDITDCGIMDMMVLDSIDIPEHGLYGVHGEEGNAWVHENGSTGIYSIQDPSDVDYKQWLTTPRFEGEKPMLPLWGQSGDEDIGDITKNNFMGFQHLPYTNYTDAMASAIEQDSFTIEDWHDMIEGIQFPSEIPFMVEDEVWQRMKKMGGMFDEERLEELFGDDWENIDWENVDWEHFSTGDQSLDNFLIYAVQQGLLTRATGVGNLCCYSSYMMVAMFLNPDQAADLYNNLASNVFNYCRASDGLFQTGTFLSDMGLTQQPQKTYTYTPTMRDEMKGHLDSGKPFILQVKGSWETTNGTQHTNSQHFIVGYGYDETGIYICDPAHGNYTMPWQEVYKQCSGNNGTGVRYISN